MSNEVPADKIGSPVKPTSLFSPKQIIGAILGIVVGTIIFNMNPLSGLTAPAMKALGIFIWAVIFWIFEVVPNYITALMMCGLWVVFKIVPFPKAFASFSSTTIWLLISAMGMGVAMKKSGLLERAALNIINIFPGTFKGMTLALLTSGTIVAPMVPSQDAKCVIASPLVKSISEMMGYESKSRGAAGMFAAMFIGFGATGPMFLSGSFVCYLLLGLLPKGFQEQFTWMTWFQSIWPWGLVLLIGSYFAIQYLYAPKEEKHLQAGYISEQLSKLGPITRDEKITLIVVLAALILWMTQSIHGINSTLVAIAAMSVLVCCKVFNRQDFRLGIPWEAICFVGGIVNLASVLPAVKVDKWIGNILGPYIAPLISNMYLFIVVSAIVLYLIRFVLVSQVAAMTIFVMMVTPFALQIGVNPWVPAVIAMTSIFVWNVIYQNTPFLVGFYAADGMVSFKQMVKMSIAYMIISVLGLLACVPVWKFLGLVPY